MSLIALGNCSALFDISSPNRKSFYSMSVAFGITQHTICLVFRHANGITQFLTMQVALHNTQGSGFITMQSDSCRPCDRSLCNAITSVPCLRVLQTQKLRPPVLRTHSCQSCSLKSLQLDQSIAMHALPADRNNLDFCHPGPFYFIFFQILSLVFPCIRCGCSPAG